MLSGNMRIRSYMEEVDRQVVEELERACEAGPSTARFSIFTDTLGDPLCRIRHFALHTMLVAEIRGGSSYAWEIAGVVRAGLKHVAYTTVEGTPIYAFTAYILGLRVSPYHRRKGIGMELVKSIEKWSVEQGVEYVYMASDQDNHASINLFTRKLGYRKFRTPAILLQPVYVGAMRIPSRIRIVLLSTTEAEVLYRATFGAMEFFPSDIGTVLCSPLTAGTWAAYYVDEKSKSTNDGNIGNDNNKSWAVLSVWRCNRIFRFHVRGAPWWARALVKANRGLGHVFAPCVALPTFPDVFSCPFGAQVMYGLHASGAHGGELLHALCAHAHNQARAEGCKLLATELGATCDPATLIPHWKRLSRTVQDVWCIKRLQGNNNNNSMNPIRLDWSTLPPPPSPLFVDPRDF